MTASLKPKVSTKSRFFSRSLCLKRYVLIRLSFVTKAFELRMNADSSRSKINLMKPIYT